MKSKFNWLITIIIVLIIYCFNLNVTIKKEIERYDNLYLEYSNLILKYNEQIEKIDDLNINHVKEIEELNEQSIQLVNKINELTENVTLLKEDLEKMKK